MVKHLPKLLLLAALLITLAVSGIPALAGRSVCQCVNYKCALGKGCPQGGCTFDKKTSQCVNTSCDGECY